MIRIQSNERSPHIIAHLETSIFRGIQNPVMIRLNPMEIVIVILARLSITIIGYRITITITNTGTFAIIRLFLIAIDIN